MVNVKFGVRLFYVGVKLLDYNINIERVLFWGRLKIRCEVIIL